MVQGMNGLESIGYRLIWSKNNHFLYFSKKIADLNKIILQAQDEDNLLFLL